MRQFLFSAFFSFQFIVFGIPAIAHAETSEPLCEVMAIDGTADLVNDDGTKTTLKEGDLVKPGGVVQTQNGSTDIAFDKDWNNVVRIESGAKAKIRSVYPSRVEILNGAVFAKLKKLPKDSIFEVQTPTAVAAVRGTEYRAVFENGQTQVYNFSASDVYVYGVDAQGQKTKKSIVLAESQKTQVTGTGEVPKPPQPMGISESQEGKSVQSALDGKVKRVVESGRVGKIHDVASLEALKASSNARKPKGESRVVDTRRREFK